MNFLAQTSSTATTSGVTFPTLVLTAMVWSAVIFALVALLMPNQTQDQLRRMKSLGSTGAGAALFFAIWAVETQVSEAAAGTGGIPGGDLLEEVAARDAAGPCCRLGHLGLHGPNREEERGARTRGAE